MDVQGSGDFEYAVAGCLFYHLNLRRDSLLEKLNVGDDAHTLVVLVQRFKGTNREIQDIGIQTAESFVNEERIDPDVSSGQFRQTKSQRQTGQKTFPAGKAGHGTRDASLVQVFDLKLEFLLREPPNPVPIAQPAQVPVCVADEYVQRDTLRVFAELRAIVGTNQPAHKGPDSYFSFVSF